MYPFDAARIHEASLAVLREVGVAFHGQRAIDTFKHHGFKTDGKVVFMEPDQVHKALDSVPSDFILHGRNPEKNIHIGSGTVAFAPGYGAPHLMTRSGEKKAASLKDYQNFCKLAQTSEVINVSGFLVVDPDDLPRATYHRDMLYCHMTLCDMPFMGSPLSDAAIKDAMRMACILFGLDYEENRPFKPVMVSNINSLAPLQYAEEMADSMIISARQNQPVIIMGAGIMGASSPLLPAGHVTVQNACVLAGLVLTQLVAPGAPVIYGGGGSQLDMQSGSYFNGSSEGLIGTRAAGVMAKHYNLPSRSGGGLNDAHNLDFQAGAQAAMSLFCTMRSGVDFILHACGILAAFMAMSYDKFIADEELILCLQKLAGPMDVRDQAIDLDTIRQVGPGGEYLTHKRTLEQCRSVFTPTRIMNRLPFDTWQDEGAPDIYAKTGRVLDQRFEAYRKPDIDPSIEKDLKNYMRS